MLIPEQILDKMENGAMDTIPSPNIDTYITIMNGWNQGGNLDKMEQTLQRLEMKYQETKDEVLLPTIQVYNELLSAWLKSETDVAPQKAEDVLIRLMDGGKATTTSLNISTNTRSGTSIDKDTHNDDNHVVQ
mmetsp:Transcript_11940/g.13896  ORF Transcript_11940/g.13896 Transcript_11940/m.13896 type:complete len:132 (+) Transcript_11940:274-669(+)